MKLSKKEKETSIDKMLKDLKKAQDSLRKSIAAEKSKIEALEAKKMESHVRMETPL